MSYAITIYLTGAAVVAVISARWEDALLWPWILGVALFKRAREISK